MRYGGARSAPRDPRDLRFGDRHRPRWRPMRPPAPSRAR